MAEGTKLPSADLIQDITTRFILTAPAEQLAYFESIMFLVEQAHWYYEDFVREQDSSLKSLSLRDFALTVFDNCPELQQHTGDMDTIMDHFKAFKKAVPVMGGILLDRDLSRVLLVKGWKNSACWGFPRGKIHKNETDAQCAVREVLEETGYDIETLVSEADFIELTLEGKRNKLFIVPGLDPDSAQFAPKCKGEIGGYAWHRIADLPSTRDEGNQTFMSDDGVKHKFFMVWPYLKPLRKWIKKRQLGSPDWDMPTPERKAARPRSSGGGVASASAAAAEAAAAAALHAPFFTHQEDASLHGTLLEPLEPPRAKGKKARGGDKAARGGAGGGGSPKYAQHAQHHEAAISAAQHAAKGSAGNLAGLLAAGPGRAPPQQQPQAPQQAPAGSASGGAGLTGPLAALFAGAAAAAAGTSGTNSASGASSNSNSSASRGGHGFRFDRHAILTALVAARH